MTLKDYFVRQAEFQMRSLTTGNAMDHRLIGQINSAIARGDLPTHVTASTIEAEARILLKD